MAKDCLNHGSDANSKIALIGKQIIYLLLIGAPKERREGQELSLAVFYYVNQGLFQEGRQIDRVVIA